MPKRKKKAEPPIPILRVRKGASLKEIYAKAREAFTAADLQRFTDLDEPTVPAREVLAKMEAYQRTCDQRKSRKRKKGA